MGALIGSRRIGPSPGSVRTRMILAAASKFGSTFTSTTYATIIFRSKYILTQDMASLMIEPHNWLYPSDQSTQGFTITQCYIESGSSGAVAQVKWSGNASTTVAANTVCRNPSDIIYPPALGVGLFTAGSVIYVRTLITAPIGIEFPGCSKAFVTAAEAGIQYNSATTTTNSVSASGTIGVTSGSDSAGMNGTYHPILVGVRNSTSSRAAIMLVGDSEVDNDDSTWGANSYVSIATRSTVNALLTISHGGRSQADLASNLEWAQAMKYCSVLLDDHGTNAPTDFTSQLTYYILARSTYNYSWISHIGLYPQSLSDLGLTSLTSSGTTATGVVPDTSNMVTGRSVKITGCTSPTTAYNGTYTITVVDSTHFTYTFAGTSGAAATGSPAANDLWQTLYYQSFNSGSTNANAFNAWIVTKVNDGTSSSINGQWTPTSTSIRDATNSNAWKSTGTAAAYTIDGLHMNPNGAGNPIPACGSEFTPILSGWVSGLLAPTT